MPEPIGLGRKEVYAVFGGTLVTGLLTFVAMYVILTDIAEVTAKKVSGDVAKEQAAIVAEELVSKYSQELVYVNRLMRLMSFREHSSTKIRQLLHNMESVKYGMVERDAKLDATTHTLMGWNLETLTYIINRSKVRERDFLRTVRNVYAKAKYHAKEALEQEPNDFEALYLAGYISYKMGDYVEAETHLKAADKIIKTSPAIKNLLARICFRQKRYGEAITYLEELIQDSDEVCIITHTAWYNIGCCCAKLYEKATEEEERKNYKELAFINLKRSIGYVGMAKKIYEGVDNDLRVLKAEYPESWKSLVDDCVRVWGDSL